MLEILDIEFLPSIKRHIKRDCIRSEDIRRELEEEKEINKNVLVVLKSKNLSDKIAL